MRFELNGARESYGVSSEQFAKAAGVNSAIYEVFENSSVIPSLFLYSLWRKYPAIELPDDFFLYTSYTLAINVRFHAANKEEICKIFGISEQALDSYMNQDLKPMYEMKERFISLFSPLLMPCVVENDDVIGKIDDYRYDKNVRKQLQPKFKVIQGKLDYQEKISNTINCNRNADVRLYIS